MDPVADDASRDPPDPPVATAPLAAPSERWSRIFRRIKETKVVQWAIAYLAAALALGQGYQLVAEAYRFPEIAGRLFVGLLLVGLPIAIVIGWYHGDRKLRNVSGAEATIISILLLIGAGLLVAFARPAEDRGASAVAAAARAASSNRVRIAILPFSNLSPDPSHAYFTDGLHEEILATLARRAPTLDVISRTTVMMYRTAPKPVPEIARELAASYVLEGSVRREGDEVRVTLQLIDPATDGHRWVQQYDRTLRSSLTLQSEVAAEVAANLSVELTGSGGAPTTDPDAYDLYLQARLGLQLLGPFIPLEEYREVEDYLTRAIARDPQFAAAYVERAGTRLLMHAFNHDSSSANATRIRADIEAARRLRADEASLLAAEAQYASIVEADHARALESFQGALAAGLTDPGWLLSGTYIQFRTNRVAAALELGDRLMELDPGNAFLFSALAAQRIFSKRPQEALRIIDRGLAKSPTFVPLLITRRTVVTSFAGRDSPEPLLAGTGDPTLVLDETFNRLMREGRFAELVSELGRVPPVVRVVTGGTTAVAFGVGERPIAELRGWAHLLLGDTAAVRQDGDMVLEFLASREETPSNRWMRGVLRAEAHLFRGEREPALQAVRDNVAAAAASGDELAKIGANLGGAGVRAWLDEDDLAVELLEGALSGDVATPPGPLVWDPRFAKPLADNARYRALVERITAQWAAADLQ